MVGQSIAHYRIVKKIGAGGMGQVFLAEDTKLDRQVAIKVLLSPNPNESQVARFHREAKAAAALNHPNIVSIHELGTAGLTSYVVMEWLEGQTLRQRLEDGPPPPLAVALSYARDIIQGVVAAHEKGIYHRDLKPENIFITTDGRIKILDFGLAQMRATSQLEGADNDVTGLVTTPGTMIGTTVYMSPEQIRGEAADHRSDIFAVGMMLFELLTGVRAFREPTIVETMHAILKQPAPLDRIDPAVPPAVVEIVRRCLEKQPADRFESARELAMAMQAVTDGTAGSGRSLSAFAAAPVTPRVTVSNSIAVLPFANMSGDADMEYFSDGVTEEVINAIAQVKGLQVAARTSSFAFKGKSVSIQEVGAALNVATVLEGSVRRSGQKLRITAQLIDVANGYQLWSERYDRQLDDVFAIQEDIATQIVQKLKVALTSSAIGAVARPAATIEAYDLYLKGRYLVEQRGEAIVKGLECFKQAIAVDPEYALAYAGLAETLALLGIYGVVPHARVFPGREGRGRCAPCNSTIGSPKPTTRWRWSRCSTTGTGRRPRRNSIARWRSIPTTSRRTTGRGCCITTTCAGTPLKRSAKPSTPSISIRWRCCRPTRSGSCSSTSAGTTRRSPASRRAWRRTRRSSCCIRSWAWPISARADTTRRSRRWRRAASCRGAIRCSPPSWAWSTRRSAASPTPSAFRRSWSSARRHRTSRRCRWPRFRSTSAAPKKRWRASSARSPIASRRW